MSENILNYSPNSFSASLCLCADTFTLNPVTYLFEAFSRHDIRATNREPVENQEVGDQKLRLGHKLARGLGPLVQPQHMNQTLLRAADQGLSRDAGNQLALSDPHDVVLQIGEQIDVVFELDGVGLLLAGDQVDVLGDDETHDLLASPQGLGENDSGHGNFALEVLDVHDHVHDLLLGQKDVPLQEQTDTCGLASEKYLAASPGRYP